VTGEVIADTADRRVEILCETDAVHATRTRLGPRRAGTDPHVHHRHSDVFYVLEGELTLRLGSGDGDGDGDGELTVTPGTLAVVPPLVVHGYRNASDADVVFLNVHAPGSGFAAYLRALRDGGPHAFDQHPPPPGGGRPATDATVVRLETDGGDRPAGSADDALAVVRAALARFVPSPGVP
jgi:mannose-6-phosphate isomerase-like protein (cupin superfamily)